MRSPAPKPSQVASREFTSDLHLDLVAAVLRALGLRVVGLPQRLLGAHAHRVDVVLGHAARDELARDRRGALLRQLLVVVGFPGRVGVAVDDELPARHPRRAERLLGVDERVRQFLRLGVATRRELVAVHLEAALVLSALGDKLGVDFVHDRLVRRLLSFLDGDVPRLLLALVHDRVEWALPPGVAAPCEDAGDEADSNGACGVLHVGEYSGYGAFGLTYGREPWDPTRSRPPKVSLLPADIGTEVPLRCS